MAGPQIVDPASGLRLVVDPEAFPPLPRALSAEANLNEPPSSWPRSGLRNIYYREFSILDGDCNQWTSSPSPEDLRALRIWNLPNIP